jgi:hypothetical protein
VVVDLRPNVLVTAIVAGLIACGEATPQLGRTPQQARSEKPAATLMESLMQTFGRDRSQVLELRQYTLHPGKRDVLIDLFDRLFLDPQEQLGMRILGQFRDLDDPNRFVWLRGFPDLQSRAGLLAAFYGGPVWKANRDAANETMVDSDNVLLLRPTDADSGLVLPIQRADPQTVQADPSSFVLAIVYLLQAPVDDEFVKLFREHISPIMAASGAPPLASYRTEYGRNDFPKLPVRVGEHIFVWFTSFESMAEYERFRSVLGKDGAWTTTVEPALTRRFKSPPQVLKLAPTARSLLRHFEPVGYTLFRNGGPHDFDFIAGDWSVSSRRLKVRGAGSTDWEEFPGTSHAALHLGGIANVDEITFPTKGWAGMTVRSFNQAARQWSLRWISSRTGAMDAGVVGGFEGDRGAFYGDDEDDGKRVKVRYVWTRLGADAAHWEQAFSYDGGPWETNWIMDFRRAAAR